jgi:hypothetical protein
MFFMCSDFTSRAFFWNFVRKSGLYGWAQIDIGYPGINDSGNPMMSAPFEAASFIRAMTLRTPPFRSSHAGSAWTAATLVFNRCELFVVLGENNTHTSLSISELL